MCNCEKLLSYNVSVMTFTQNSRVDLDPRCNGVTVKNAGTSTANFNGVILAPNESIAIGGNRGELYTGRVDVSFSGSGTNLINVIQKYYISNCL